jgi:hypothetical protein
MAPNVKRKILACLLGIIILTVLVAAALPRLELKPGVPLPGQPTGTGSMRPDEIWPLPAISVNSFWKAVLGILLLAGLIYNLYRLLKDARWSWKDVVRSLFYLALPILALVAVIFILSRVPFTLPAAQPEMIPPTPVPVEGPPLGAIPSGLIWLVWLGLAAALAGLGLWLVFRPPARPMPDPLQLEAERALQALNDGLDLKNVILRCYSQMAQVLKREQGLEMEVAMTAREFERLVEARGVPPTPVQQLTQLFEAARYGHRPPGPGDERQAVDCLTAIVRHGQAGK